MRNRNKIGVARGAAYGMIAQSAFLGSGYIIHLFVGRHCGPVDYGNFATVIGLITMINALITTGFPMSASRYIAEDNARLGSIVRDSNKIQMAASLVLFCLYIALAKSISELLEVPVSYIIVSAFSIPVSAFFSMYRRGYLNGMRYFDRQSFSLIAHSAIKILAVFALVLLGFGVKGVIAGYVLAAMSAFLLAKRLLGPVEKTVSGFGWQKLVGFGISVTAFYTCSLLAGQMSLFVIKSIGENEELAGYYASAMTVGKLGTIFIGALTITLYPALSRSFAMNDMLEIRNYIQRSLRYVLILIIPCVLLVSATSEGFITIFYSSVYAAAADALSILVFGIGSMALFGLLANIIMASGKPHIALWLIVLMLGMEVILNLLLVPDYEIEGAALAHTITAIIGLCASAAYVFSRFKVLVNFKSLVRITTSALLVYMIALQISVSAHWIPLIYLGLLTLYGGLLLLSKELVRDDWNTIKRAVPIDRLLGGDDSI